MRVPKQFNNITERVIDDLSNHSIFRLDTHVP